MRIHSKPFTGDLEQHTETGFCAPKRLANGWVLVGTDVGNIGGQHVGDDGSYLVDPAAQRILYIDFVECPFESEDED